jgi:hypothetical protein
MIVWFQLLFAKGAVAKWQGKGLQNLHRRFDSASRLQFPNYPQKVVVILSEVAVRPFLSSRSCGTRSHAAEESLLAFDITGPDKRF